MNPGQSFARRASASTTAPSRPLLIVLGGACVSVLLEAVVPRAQPARGCR